MCGCLRCKGAAACKACHCCARGGLLCSASCQCQRHALRRAACWRAVRQSPPHRRGKGLGMCVRWHMHPPAQSELLVDQQLALHILGLPRLPACMPGREGGGGGAQRWGRHCHQVVRHSCMPPRPTRSDRWPSRARGGDHLVAAGQRAWQPPKGAAPTSRDELDGHRFAGEPVPSHANHAVAALPQRGNVLPSWVAVQRVRGPLAGHGGVGCKGGRASGRGNAQSHGSHAWSVTPGRRAAPCGPPPAATQPAWSVNRPSGSE